MKHKGEPLPSLSPQQIIGYLGEVRALLVEKGWTQRRAVDENGRICLGHAVDHITSMHSLEYTQWGQLHAALLDTISLSTITRYNDAPGRTLADILNLIDRAIEKLR